MHEPLKEFYEEVSRETLRPEFEDRLRRAFNRKPISLAWMLAPAAIAYATLWICTMVQVPESKMWADQSESRLGQRTSLMGRRG